MTLPDWPYFLQFRNTLDGLLRAIIVLLACFVIVKYSTLFEEDYHRRLTTLYMYPWWRILIVLLLIAALSWCPRVGILIAVIVFFYLSDMNALFTPLPNL
jgi:hypothetical protein